MRCIARRSDTKMATVESPKLQLSFFRLKLILQPTCRYFQMLTSVSEQPNWSRSENNLPFLSRTELVKNISISRPEYDMFHDFYFGWWCWLFTMRDVLILQFLCLFLLFMGIKNKDFLMKMTSTKNYQKQFILWAITSHRHMHPATNRHSAHPPFLPSRASAW